MYAAVQTRLDALTRVTEENLSGVRVVKAFVRADHEEGRFRFANERLTEQALRAARTAAVMLPFMIVTVNLGVVSVLYFGGAQVIQGHMHVGQIIAFINYLVSTLFSLMMVSQLVIQLARAGASAKRIQEVLDVTPLVQDRRARWPRSSRRAGWPLRT